MAEQQRKAFEAWQRSEGAYVGRTEDGNYADLAVQSDWRVWQAALSHAEGAEADRIGHQLAVGLYRAGWDDHKDGRDYDPRGCDEWRDVVDAIFRKVPAPQVAVPEGWKLVPVELPEEMESAFCVGQPVGFCAAVKTGYTRMLAAAPAAPGCDSFEHEENCPVAAYADAPEQPASDPDGPLNSSLALIDQIIEQLEKGFVVCNSCGDQEDTATLDVMDDLLCLRSLIAAASNRSAPDEREIAARALDGMADTLVAESDEADESTESAAILRAARRCRVRATRLRAGKGGE